MLVEKGDIYILVMYDSGMRLLEVVMVFWSGNLGVIWELRSFFMVFRIFYLMLENFCNNVLVCISIVVCVVVIGSVFLEFIILVFKNLMSFCCSFIFCCVW